MPDFVSQYSKAFDIKPPSMVKKPAAVIAAAVPELRTFKLRAPEEADLGQDLVIMPVELAIPKHWTKGQLLNVRNNGHEFVLTVLGEEFDPRYPERALKFDNSWTCQAFISKWYQREHHDPRAF